MASKTLFQINGKPLQFCIYRGGNRILQIKYNHLVKDIEAHGGVIKEYNDENKHNCIILIDESYGELEIEVENSFSYSFIKRSIKENKLLGLRGFSTINRLKTKSIRLKNYKKDPLPVIGKNCPDLDKLKMEKCEHLANKTTIEEDLEYMEKMLMS